VSSACLFQIRCLPQAPPQTLGIIAGNGVYPRLLANAARKAGVKKIIAAAFTGETDPVLEQHVDLLEWMRVGQLNRLLRFFRTQHIHHAIMAGQIAPKNLFDLRPDWKALMLLGKLRQRNAESIFAAIADELANVDVHLLAATTFLEDSLASSGLIAGPKLSRQEQDDVDLGCQVAKEIARLDVGQTVIVKNGTVVAVEALEGTNDALRRGGALAREGAIMVKVAKEIARLDVGQTVIVKNGTVVAVEALEGTNDALRRGGALAREGAIMVKVTKPKQDMRFDVPVIGVETIRIAAEARLRVIAVEAGKTLLLERDAIVDLANRSGISIVARVS